MADPTQLNLGTSDFLDWDNYDSGSAATKLPQAKDETGSSIVYYAQLPTEEGMEFGYTQNGDQKVTLDPVTITAPIATGFQLRFQQASQKRFTDRKTGKTLNASQVGNLLRAAGVASVFKPQTDGEYQQALKAAAGKIVPVVIDWECYDKTTKQTVVAGYDNFEGPSGGKNPVVTTQDGRKLVARARIKAFVQQTAQ